MSEDIFISHISGVCVCVSVRHREQLPYARVLRCSVHPRQQCGIPIHAHWRSCVKQMSLSGENRERYIQLLLRGLYTPWTLPVGSSEQALQGLIDSFSVNTLILPKRTIKCL